MNSILSSQLIGRRLLAKNSFFNLVGQAIPILVALAVIPILMRDLGMDRYSLLTLIWAILGYFALFDMGMGRSITKFVAENIGSQKKENIWGVIWVSICFILLVGFIGSIALYLAANWLIYSVFNIPDSLKLESLSAIHWLALSIPVITLTAGFRGILEAHQRFGTINFFQVVITTVSLAGPLLILPWTKDISQVVLLLVVVRVLLLVVFAWRSLKEFPHPERLAFDKETVFRFIRFGGWISVSNIISPVMVYFDRFILGALSPLAHLAFYTTPYEIINRLLFVPGAVSRVLFPAFTTADAKEKTRVPLLFAYGVHSILFIMFPIVFMCVSLGFWFLSLWLGEQFAMQSFAIMQTLAIGVFFNSMAFIPFTLLQSLERAKITAAIHLIELPFYLLLLWFGITKYGLIGAAFAWSARMIVDLVLLSTVLHRVYPAIRPVIKKLFNPLIMIIVAFAIAFVPLPLGSKVIATFVLLVCFYCYMWFWFLDSEEREAVLGLLPQKKSES